jgi:hypothetical protein
MQLVPPSPDPSDPSAFLHGWGIRFPLECAIAPRWLLGALAILSFPYAGPLAWGGLGSLISDWRKDGNSCEGWKDAAWALTPMVTLTWAWSFTN